MTRWAALIPFCLAWSSTPGCIVVTDGTDENDGGDPPVDEPDGAIGDDYVDWPSTSLPTQGDPRPPTFDEMLADDPVLESNSVIVTGVGDVLELEGGLHVDIGPGSMPVGATLTVYQHAFDGSAEGQGAAIYRFDASEQPTAPVGVTFPIPGDTPAVSEDEVFVLWFHDDYDDLAESEPAPVRGTVDLALQAVSMTTDRFSSAIVRMQGDVPVMSSADRVLRVPYFSQGQSDNCWSASFAMLLRGFESIHGVEVEPWHPNAFFGITTEEGLSPKKFLYDESIVRFIRGYLPDVRVERNFWWMFDEAAEQRVRRYLVNHLRAGHPLVVGWPGHMVLFVGVEEQDFLIHEPSGPAYNRRSWSDLVTEMRPWLTRNGPCILVLPDEEAPDSTATASIGIPYPNSDDRGGILAGKVVGARVDPTTWRAFSWYVKDLRSAAFVDMATGAPSALSMDHSLFPAIDVTNIVYGSPEHELRAGFEIYGIPRTATPIYRSTPVAACRRWNERMQCTAGGATEEVNLAGRLGVRVGDVLELPGNYELVVFVEDGGARQDSSTVGFSVEGVQSDCPSDNPVFVGNWGGPNGTLVLHAAGEFTDFQMDRGSPGGEWSDRESLGLYQSGGRFEGRLTGGAQFHAVIPPSGGGCWEGCAYGNAICPPDEHHSENFDTAVGDGEVSVTLSSDCRSVTASARANLCEVSASFSGTLRSDNS